VSALLEGPPPRSLAQLRTAFRDGKSALLQHFRETRASAPSAAYLTRALTRHVDATLTELWQRAGMPADCALVAVGGYGRGELFPYSDVDVLVLLPPEGVCDETTIEQFITACWDIGLEISSSVRNVADCVSVAACDVTVQTAQLENRLIAGSRRLHRSFVDASAQALDINAFLRAKTLEMRQRHVKYEDTPYALEPNCKESPGGLRDLQVVIWLARAAGLGRSWSELAAKGLITPFEVKQLQRNEGLLKLIRARLHVKLSATEVWRAYEILTSRCYWMTNNVAPLNQSFILNI